MISNSSDDESDDGSEPKENEPTLIQDITTRLQESPVSSLYHSEVDGEHDVEKKEKLMLYVFVSRCIAHPFNAKQQNDMTRRHVRITKEDLLVIKQRFEQFLSGETTIESDKAFHVAVKFYYDSILCSDRIVKMIEYRSATAYDFREVFKSCIENRVRNVPSGLTVETILNSWMAKFDKIYRGDDRTTLSATYHPSQPHPLSETILNKDQLYEMFQKILEVKKYEHAILYNACQLDNADEQAACIRRELQGRMDLLQKKNRNFPLFVHKSMKANYIEEQRRQINQLKTNLDSLPILNIKERPKAGIFNHDASDGEKPLSTSDVVLSFTIEVLIVEAKGLKLPPQKIVYCTMEVEGGEKFQTDQAEASRPRWDTQGEFTTTHPLPEVKVKLMCENTGVLAFDDKELAKLTCSPYPAFTEEPRWYDATPTKGSPMEKIQLKMRVKMDKPLNVKRCGNLYSLGRQVWKRWKQRYFVLVQESQYTFVLCTYHRKKGEPHEMIQLDGYTVDYMAHPCDEDYEGGKYFFCCVKEGNSVTLSADDENDRQMWVHKISQATGQSHRPVAPQTIELGTPKTNSLTKLMGDTDRARKYGLHDAVSADPNAVDQHSLFKKLQYLTLEHRLNDYCSCLGWFSPGQQFLLDEYCARYGVRGCYRHLCYLFDLLDKAESGIMVDPTLLHYSYAFCASHVHGNRPDGIETITKYEEEKFEEVKERLWHLLTNQIIHFRFVFPFGRPEGALKATLSLFERVMMRNVSTPVPSEEFQAEMRKCLNKAALVNYTKVSKFLKIEDYSTEETNPADRLDAIYQLIDHCIEVLQQNDQYHGEALEWFSDLMVEHTELFWSLFTVDLDATLDVQPPDTWDSFTVFHFLNDYFNKEPYLRNGPCHLHIQDKFAPLVIRYVDLMESSIAQSVHNGFEVETWEVVGNGSNSSDDLFYKLVALKGFIEDLHWPEKTLADHLNKRIVLMSFDMIEAYVKRVREAFNSFLKRSRFTLDYVIPVQICVMFNVIAECKKQAIESSKSDEGDRESHQRNDAEHCYHPDARDFVLETEHYFIEEFSNKIDLVLENMLKKLARFDQGTLSSHLFAFSSQSDEARVKFLHFCQANLEQIQNFILHTKLRRKLLKNWYSHIMKVLVTWLTDRIALKLHPYQLQTLFPLVKALPEDFAAYGLESSRALHSSNYRRVESRLQVEEALENGEGSVLLSNDNHGRYSDSDDDSDFSEEN